MVRKRIENFSNPKKEILVNVVRESIEKHKALLLIGNCWVIYQGRANSELSPGERIVIIKEDRALLVHRPNGYEPINWMPGGQVTIHVDLVNSELLNSRLKTFFNNQVSNSIIQPVSLSGVVQIRAVRRKPLESIKIFFDQVYLLSTFSLVDNGGFWLHASEKDMKKAILNKPEIIEEGLKLITYEKKVEPGFVDVYGIDKNGKLVVVEIKRKTANRSAVLQLVKYVDSIKAIANREVRGILVAPSIAKGVQKLLATLKMDYKALDPKKCAEILKKPEAKLLNEFL